MYYDITNTSGKFIPYYLQPKKIIISKQYNSIMNDLTNQKFTNSNKYLLINDGECLYLFCFGVGVIMTTMFPKDLTVN